MIKLFDLLIGTLRKINPQERILLIVLMIGIMFLVEVVKGIAGNTKQDYIDRISELKVEVYQKDKRINYLDSTIFNWQHKYDSLYFKGITDKQETIDKLKLISEYLKKLDRK